MARAPQAIYNLWYAIHRDIPDSQLGGIVGDPAHVYGYHRARNELPATDYSVKLAQDRAGPGDAASALDVSFSKSGMVTVTNRIIAAAKARDPRLKALREIGGTSNGTQTHSYDLATDHEGFGEWDNTHLWHVHLSFYRQYADSPELMPIADVIAGRPVASQEGQDMRFYKVTVSGVVHHYCQQGDGKVLHVAADYARALADLWDTEVKTVPPALHKRIVANSTEPGVKP